ncbi:ribosome maturation factor RimP [Ponticaulis sp.]|uniref:ribosome maturation factor RimP n=1 Tax=Ponticaulis sp. TaxID=2020902 RepID=UPI000B6C0268|nr:ribosome maturation factor RimP [Ponticaulis sp.]MAJ09540.1 ribosome maturation factor RimP [Ponticaulis sp.]RPG18883.1 MAG: ribosome maturation factor RimP [Hyphomonadaceae bacterium TMED125]HBJ94106.1 ribosome maturation factor RimP [Hyphomonadaceae bacterium]
MITIKGIEERILKSIEPEAEALGLEVVRIRMMGGRTPTLQIMVEKTNGGTDVEDCAKFSRAISPALDVHDFIDNKYHLEVSTPGIDRPLTRAKDFARWAGHLAKVELSMPIDGRRRFQGVITEEADGVVKLQLDDDTELEANVADMSKASLVLTDELIDLAQAQGELADVEDGSFDEIEEEGDAPDTEEENQS